MFRALCPLHGYELFEILSASTPPDPTVCQVNGVTPLTNVFFTTKEWANPVELLTTISLADAVAAGAGQASLVVDGAGPDMTVRVLDPGANITLTQNANTVTIAADLTDVSLADASPPVAGQASLVVDGAGPDMTVRTIQQGANILVTQLANSVQVDAAVPTITLADAVAPIAGEASLVSDGMGPDLGVRILKPGTNITLTQAANSVTITGQNTTTLGQATPGAGEAGLMIDTIGPAMSIRILKEGTNIDLTENANDVTIACSIPTVLITRSIHWCADTPYPTNLTGTFEDMLSGVFLGTTAYGATPTLFKAVIGMAGNATAECTVRVYDITNAVAVAGPASGTNVPSILTLTYNSNASTTAAIWVLQCRRTSGTLDVSASGVSILF